MFKDRVVLITGGSRGIGRAAAIKFAKLGANVIIVYKNSDKSAQDLLKEIQEFGGSLKTIKADVSEEKELHKIVETALSFYGKIDILVNNAGIVFDREFEEITYEESMQILKTNMLAPLFLSQMIAPIMLKNISGGGEHY